MLGLTMAWFLNAMGPDSPINTQLLLLFDCHLNVEISAGLGTVRAHSAHKAEALRS